jgi:hypothetical protein
VVQSGSEPLAPRARFLNDLSTLACLALLAVPLYFVLNDYWQSLLRLGGLYVALGIFCMRLGHYMRRVMRREPAEIPPWDASLPVSQSLLVLEPHVPATEAIQNVHTDPHYLQEVLKPRLQHVLVYRLWGMPKGSFATLEAGKLAQVDPGLVQFLQRRERTGLWARYVHRQQRVNDVLETLQRLETL